MNKLNIMGRTWEIYLEPNEYVYAEGEGSSGTANHFKQEMHIANNVHQERKETVCLHEIIHVIKDIQALDMTEHTIELLEAGLYQFLKENNIYQIWKDLEKGSSK